VSSADGDKVTAALTDAAKGMSTLDVQASKLASAVSGFPTVASVTADPSFPHGLTVHVTERTPALIVSDGHNEIAAAGDGSLLPGADTNGSDLPLVHVDSIPSAGRLGGEPLQEVHVVAAAPSPLRPLITAVAMTRDYGIDLSVKPGIELRFGTAGNSSAKWAAVSAILADPSVTSLRYMDVRVPSRPAIGG
jgi:cell division protein FtsQ